MRKSRAKVPTSITPIGRRNPPGVEKAKAEAPRIEWRRMVSSPPSIAILAVTAVFLVLWPFGEYAVDDEWAYLKSLEHLHADGEVRILDWNPMSLVGLLYWGSIFTKLAGFSFTVARLSAFVSFILLALSVALVLRHLGVDRSRATMAVLAVVFNPLTVFHGVLYMTDIPACAVATLAVLFMLKGLEGDSPRQRWLLIAGSACAAVGFLIRQGVIVVSIALLVYLVIFNRRRLRSLDGMLAALVLPAATVVLFNWWYTDVHGATVVYLKQSQAFSESLWRPDIGEMFEAAVKNAIYVGFFVLPLAAAGMWRLVAGRAAPARSTRRPIVGVLLSLAPAAVAIAVVGLVLAEARDGVVFPYLPNKITPFGFVGPNELIVGDRPVLWGPAVGWALAAGSVFAVVALTITFRRPTSETGRPVRHGIYLVALLGVLQFLFTVATYKTGIDRHLLVLLPTFAILFAAWLPRARVNRLAFALVIVPFAWYGIAGTHDVHAFSRAAFDAGAQLMQSGVPAHDIDGGYAFDGWWSFEEGWRDRISRSRETDAWWVRAVTSGVSSRYVLALSPTLEPRPNREALRPWTARPPLLGQRDVVDTRRYLGWWPYGERTLYVLRRRD